MAYKDKGKQREADRARQKRYRTKRDKHGVTKGVTNTRRDTKGVTNQGMTTRDGTANVIPCDTPDVIPKLNPYQTAAMNPYQPERTANGFIRVSKPGDADYEPMCETTRAFIEGRDKRAESAKRGKDVKCFADLSPGVRQTIDEMSTVDGKIGQTIKANRTAIAVHYQHLFPDRYYSTGVH